MTVFERSSGGVRATMAGRDFLRTARSILEQMDSLAKSTHHVGRGEAGRLSLSFYTSISAGNLRATLVDFQKRSHRNLPVRAILCLVWSTVTRLLTE
jgi:DNA-binding transcriptional LysR family regulator